MVAVGDSKNGVEMWTLVGQHYCRLWKCCTRKSSWEFWEGVCKHCCHVHKVHVELQSWLYLEKL